MGRTFGIVRIVLLLLVVVGSGSAITALLLPPKEKPPEAIPEPVLTVAGAELPKGEAAIGEALDRVRRFAHGEVTLVLPEGIEHRVSLPDLGVEIDRAHLAEFIEHAAERGSALQRRYADSPAGQEGRPLAVPLPLSLSTERAIDMLTNLKLDLDRPAVEAFVDVEAKTLKPERVGHRLDVYGTLARMDHAIRSGERRIEADVETIQPRVTRAMLGDLKFEQVLGYFETRYNRSKKYEDRTYNLRLAASKLNGAVIMPGETFDFNAVVGPRDEVRGYRVAPVIAQGELVDGLGGGTCQISGTLHGAAFFAGLEIVERYAHSRPSHYMKLGLDATVAYPSINYRFRNNFDFPIVLHQTVEAGKVRAEILGPKRDYTVTYFRRIDKILPFEEVVRETDALPEGEKIVVQRGVPGFVLTSSRLVRDGAYGTRQKWKDRYPPTTQIVEVGTGDPDMSSKRRGDSHPEYTAAEYLVVTQGPGIGSDDEPGGGMIENAKKGKTGYAGWMEELGLAKSTDLLDGKKDKDEKKDDS